MRVRAGERPLVAQEGLEGEVGAPEVDVADVAVRDDQVRALGTHLVRRHDRQGDRRGRRPVATDARGERLRRDRSDDRLQVGEDVTRVQDHERRLHDQRRGEVVLLHVEDVRRHRDPVVDDAGPSDLERFGVALEERRHVR